MIYIIDNFIEKNNFQELQDKLNNNKYIEYQTPGKSFWIQEANEEFVKSVSKKLSIQENCNIEPILGFFRISTDKIDVDWRIHADGIMFDQKPDRAVVLYISPTKLNKLHGTAFWEHEKYGNQLPINTTNKEHDRMLEEDANNLDKWKLNTVLGYKQNRLISYPANYFHSKYPNESWEKGRQVFVMFYKIKLN
tara:strand:- start:2024 stop:2602 length:579 start_codon:yes stop_codon:yes gene_type:complete